MTTDHAPSPAAGVRSPSTPARWMLRAIRWYQRGVEGRPSPCRFFPSCSAYAHEAIEVHGAARGGWLAVRRLVRCRPLGPSGFDPVPDPTDRHGAVRAGHPVPDRSERTPES